MRNTRKPLFGAGRSGPWAKDLTLIMQIGLTMAGCIGFCFFLGRLLDGWLGLRGIFTAVGTLLGVAGGANVVYRQIMQTLTPPEQSDTPDDDRAPPAS